MDDILSRAVSDGYIARHFLTSESPMENTPRKPVMPFGVYRMEDASYQYGTAVQFKCTECKLPDIKARPVLEVSAQHMCVAVVCPNCGANNPLVYGPVQRVTWQPVPDQEHT